MTLGAQRERTGEPGVACTDDGNVDALRGLEGWRRRERRKIRQARAGRVTHERNATRNPRAYVQMRSQ